MKSLVAMFIAVVMWTQSGSAEEPWRQFGDPFKDRGSWRTYYLEHAQVRLGPESRLRNGIAWRLHTDTVTGVALPRITWMPDGRQARVANELFDMAHGGALLGAMAIHQDREELRAQMGQLSSSGDAAATLLANSSELNDPTLVEQTQATLTYASDNLASFVDFESAHTGGMRGSLYLRAITFDLTRRELYYSDECAGNTPDHEAPQEPGADFLFRFGPLLHICDRARHDTFRRIYAMHVERAVEKAANDPDPVVRQCIHHYAGGEVDLGEQKVLLYLTFDGLAVQRESFLSGSESDKYTCPSHSAINPTIIPYRDLASLMEPGSWRDELLALP